MSEVLKHEVEEQELELYRGVVFAVRKSLFLEFEEFCKRRHTSVTNELNRLMSIAVAIDSGSSSVEGS